MYIQEGKDEDMNWTVSSGNSLAENGCMLMLAATIHSKNNAEEDLFNVSLSIWLI